MTIKDIKRNILRLKPVERIRIVEHILRDLHGTDPKVERAWGIESDKRLNAFKKDKTKGFSIDAVKKNIKQ